MIVINDGVDARGLHIIIWDMIFDILPFFDEVDSDLVITSALEGDHGLQSRHYSGLAVSIDSENLEYPQDMFNRIQSILHPGYNIVMKSNYFDIEYNPDNQNERITCSIDAPEITDPIPDPEPDPIPPTDPDPIPDPTPEPEPDPIPPTNGVGELIESQDFSAPGWENEFTGWDAWGNHLAVVQDNPHPDYPYSLRGNQLPNVVDGITGLPGIGSSLLDWRGATNSIPEQTPHELFFRYEFRHDDYTSDLDNDGSGEGKLIYFIDRRYSTKGMYLNNQLAGGGVLRLKYSNGGYPDRWSRDNWDYDSLNLRNPNVQGGTDGVWKRLEYYINYDEHYIQIFVDGHIMTSRKHGDPAFPALPADGRIYYDPELTLKTQGFQFWWTRTSNIDESTDRKGYACGWQITGLKAWNGMPPNRQIIVPS